ncbi:MAG: TonB-dependent receptor domain-containing protein, partial [Bacteroidota bacterium]
LAWRVSEEGFLKNSKTISNLKVRLGWGQTGNPSLPVDFIYLAKYTPGASSAAYQFGNTFINTLRPEGYNAEIKWETQTTQNVGIDFGFANNRINGSVDIYNKKTENLINYIPLAAGTNLTNFMWSNVGNMENKGFEIMLNAQIINKPNFTWDFGVTFAQNKNTITKLLQVQDSNYLGVAGGGISGGVGNNIQLNSVGNSINSFYAYQQVYDASGKPIEGVYVDKNGDGVVDAKDKSLYKSSEPTQILGFTNNIRYNKWTLNMTLRANMGQYIYNNNASNLGTMQNIYNSAGYLNNVHSSVLTTNFQAPQYWSNYYIENGSFLRMDNINLGYNVGSIFNKKASLRLSAIVQNAFVITKYSGIDPEVSSGIDNNKYPRPRIFSLGANLQF